MLEINKKSKISKVFEFIHEHIIAVIIIVVVLAGAVSTAYIFEEKNIEKTNNEKPGVTYKDCDTIYLSMERTESLNPYTSGSEDVYYISQLIYSSLFKLNKNLAPVPDLVKEYSTDPAEGTVSIKLKDNVKFSNDSTLTAYDVKESVGYIKSAGEKSPYFNYVSKIKYVDVEGDEDLEIVFEKPDDAAVDNLVFPIVCADDYSSEKSDVAGSGPYKYKSYDLHKSLKLSPNKYFYKGKPSNKVEIKVLPDKTKSVNLMEIDAITAHFMEIQDADMVAEDFHLKETPVISNETEYLGFNFDKYILSHKEMRQAIAYAINTDSIIKDNYGGAAIASDTIYFPGFLGTKNEGDVYAYNQSAAIELLNDLGYKDIDEDGIIEDKKGKELDFDIIVNSNDKSRVLSAKLISGSLRQIGIKSDIKKLSWDEYIEALENGDFDLCLGGYKFDKQYNLKKLFEKNNILSYNNIAMLKDINKLETSLTAKEQKKIYMEIKKELIEEIPYYCLCYKTYSFLTVEHFEGEVIPTFFDRFRGCSSWKWQKVEAPVEEQKEKKN